MKVIPDNHDSKFIDLVNIIERGYRDLKRINFEKEMSNSTTVSMLEAIVPRTIRREWSWEVNRKDSRINDTNQFKNWLDFLLEQKQILEHKAADLHKGSDSTTSKCYCWIHKSNVHSIEECYSYINKMQEERVACVKEFAACFNCLATEHRLNECPGKKM